MFVRQASLATRRRTRVWCVSVSVCLSVALCSRRHMLRVASTLHTDMYHAVVTFTEVY